LAGDPNPYAYAKGRASVLTDPDGLDTYDSDGNGREGGSGDVGCPTCGDSGGTSGVGCPPAGTVTDSGLSGPSGGYGDVKAVPKPILPKILSVVSQAAAYQNTVAVGTLRELGTTAKIVTAGVSPITVPLLLAQRGDHGMDNLYAMAEKGVDPGLRTMAMVHSKVGAAVITAAGTAGAGSLAGTGSTAAGAVRTFANQLPELLESEMGAALLRRC
jgi:hypothetical protein